MSKTTAHQNSHSHLDRVRICSRCKKEETSFLNHLSIIAKRKRLRGSFELAELHEILDDFNNNGLEVFCNHCYHFVKYNTCQCGKYRHTKEIEVKDSKKKSIYFTLCRECVYKLFKINFDDYDSRQNEITLKYYFRYKV